MLTDFALFAGNSFRLPNNFTKWDMHLLLTMWGTSICNSAGPWLLNYSSFFLFLFYSRHNFWDIFVIFNAMYFMLNVISLILSPSSLCPTSIALQVLCHFHSSTSFSLPKILLYWHYYWFFLLSFWTAILVSRCLSEVHSKVHLFIKLNTLHIMKLGHSPWFFTIAIFLILWMGTSLFLSFKHWDCLNEALQI